MGKLNFVISIPGGVAVIIIFGKYLGIVGCDVIGNQPTKSLWRTRVSRHKSGSL